MKKLEVVVVGLTNCGKSTFVNSIMNDQSICIVSSKPHTTRKITLGSFVYKDVHVILYDTPGFNSSKKKSIKTISDMAKNAVYNKDLCVVMFDGAKRIPEFLIDFTQSVQGIPKIALINKTDKITGGKLLPIMDQLKDHFADIIPISALRGINIELVLDLMIKYAVKMNDQNPFVTNMSEEQRIIDRTQEVIFELFDEEVPYSTIVNIADVQIDGNTISIWETINVEHNHYSIVVSKIKEIGTLARQKLISMLCDSHVIESLKMIPLPEKINKVNLFLDVVRMKK
jgi:GTP-binding protein Era